jgi:serine O-acetyltransferase
MFDIFKQDVEKWVSLEGGNQSDKVTLLVTLKLLYRQMPLRATAWFRLANWCKRHHVRMLPSVIQHHILRVFGLDIVVGMDIEGGLYIAHPNGVTIAAKHIGRNCSVIGACTIGMNKEWKFPVIGDNVFIGSGARVLGDITIGNDVKIGANAVVLSDAPNGATLVGIPAKVISIYGKRID